MADRNGKKSLNSKKISSNKFVRLLISDPKPNPQTPKWWTQYRGPKFLKSSRIQVNTGIRSFRDL